MPLKGAAETDDDRVCEAPETVSGADEDAPTPTDLRGALADDSDDENEEPSASELLRRERKRD